MIKKSRWLVFLLIIAINQLAVSQSHSQTTTILHNFLDGSVTNDGFGPAGALVLGPDGAFYGMTAVGGSTLGNGGAILGYGTVFKITPSGTETILHSFGDGTVSDDGLNPSGALVLCNDGDFYGTTTNGGSAGFGTVFKISSSGVETILHSFKSTSATDGEWPEGPLVLGGDGNFYGTTTNGGTTVGDNGDVQGYGTVFVITLTGTETVLHSFGDGSVTNDGLGPTGALARGGDGDFYGTTNVGGAPYNLVTGDGDAGTVFKITPTGVVTILHSFQDDSNPNDGVEPTNPLVLGKDGDFYGTTLVGGTTSNGGTDFGNGTVFKITPDGVLTILHNFRDGSVANDGWEPENALIQGSDGNFYGSTWKGGSTLLYGVSDGDGTVFELTPSGTLTILHDFGDGSVLNDGSDPSTPLVQGQDGNFYGMTQSGGTTATDTLQGSGTIYRVAVATPPNSWNAIAVAAVPNGTARILWTRTDGAAGVWALSASDTQTAVGPTYGPYPGWTAQAIAAASDGTSRVLWNRNDGAVGLWALSQTGVQTSVGPTYGPYSGWRAVDLATAPDGTSRVLWTNANGAAGIWSLSTDGEEAKIGPSYGPFTGWTATSVGVSSDGTARILWTRSDGAMGLWTTDASGQSVTAGSVYGPYSDSHGTWSATGLSTLEDGSSQVLWKRSDGAVGLWTFDAKGAAVTSGAVYGPYPGFAATALKSGSEQSSMLWVRSDGAAGLWNFDTDDQATVVGPVYGPY